MLQVKDQDNLYYLNDIGQLVVEPINQPEEAYAVRPQDFSEFEYEVAQFLGAVND
jgi:hypothetical protein